MPTATSEEAAQDAGDKSMEDVVDVKVEEAQAPTPLAVEEAKTEAGTHVITETTAENTNPPETVPPAPKQIKQELPIPEAPPQDVPAPPNPTQEATKAVAMYPLPPAADVNMAPPHQHNPAPEYYPPHAAMPPHHHHPPPSPVQAHSPHDEGTAKRKKRQYIIKNPNRPKRPLSAYNVFFKYERERLVREEMLKDDNADKEKVEELIAIRDKTKTGKRVHRKTHGAIAFADLGKLISKNWKALSEEEREKYAAEANIDKERYQRELETSQATMAQEPPKPQQPGPKNRNKRLGDAPMEIRDSKRTKPLVPYDGYTGYDPPHPYPPGPSPRGGYYDPYFGYARPPNMYPPPPPGADGPHPGYGPPPPGYGPPPPGYGPPPPHGPHYYPPPPPPDYYYGRPPPPLTPGAEGKDGTQQAFAPPYPPYPGYPPRPPVPMQAPNEDGNPHLMPPSPRAPWMPNPGPEHQHPAECAYQCEVCNNAVFSTFKECADHEEECAKKHGKPSSKEEPMPMPEGNSEAKPHPSPTTKKKEEKEQQAAVEAVLLLKTGTETVDV